MPLANGLPPAPRAAAQAVEEQGRERRRGRGSGGAQRALARACVALPTLDDRAILRPQRPRRPAALHGGFCVGDACVDIAESHEGRRQLAREDVAVPRELAVLEHDGLMRLVEHGGELEVRGELAIHRRGRQIERPLARTIAPPQKPVQEAHAPMLAQRAVCIDGALWIHLLYIAGMPGPFGRVAAPPPHFPVGGPVPAADLVGRESYIRRAVERLADGNHLLVAGPRRIGKTSIILEVLRRLRRKGALTAYVDCLGATDVRGLGERLADAVLENVSGVERTLEQAKAVAAGMRPSVKVRYEHVELALQLARETNAQRFFDGALDLPRTLAARSGKRVVVVFDEFQAAGRLGPRVFDVMRAHFQAQRGVAYAFLGSEEGIIEELFSAKGRAFFRFAVPLDLADAGGHRFGIAPDDWLEYIRGKFAERRIAIDDSIVDRLLDATGGHPQDTMQLCAALYYLVRDAGQRAVNAEMLAVAYEQAMRELERPFALHWSEIGKQKYLQAVAKRIAEHSVLYASDGEVPRPEVLRALESLRSRGLVTRLGRGKYDFIEPMFAEYVRRVAGNETAIVPQRG